MAQSHQYGVALVTTSSESEAEAIASVLVESGLAACVNLFPIRSIYTWQGQVQQEREWQLLIKTDLQKFDQLTAKVKELHSYEVPEIIALPIVAGSDDYLGWLGSSVG